MVKVSIIIPCKTIDDDVKRCVGYCEKLPEVHEVIVITDLIIPGLPSAKRNWAMQRAVGDVFAFIDADAYPSKDWLKNALYWLQTFKAVCGPGVLPPDAPIEEHIADQVHQWVFCPYRVVAKEPQIVKWFPSFNLIVRREVATQFDPYLTGEDDKFCLRIKDGIFYHPDILVYHNRRGIFKPLWRQYGTWGKHKGHFARLALIAYITTLFTYATNYLNGFFNKCISGRMR